MDDLIRHGLDSGALSFATTTEDTVAEADIVFLCLPTQPTRTGQPTSRPLSRRSRREAAGQEARDVEQMFAMIDAVKRGSDAIEADQALARRLKDPVEDVVQVARAMWGRTLTDERDARVVELGAVQTAERQARRGHITRELSQQIEAQLRAEGSRLSDGERRSD